MTPNLTPTKQIAWTSYQGKTYQSACDVSPHAPHTAVTGLIQGLYDLLGHDAFRVVRQRIYAWPFETDLCKAMVKVAAKRLSVAAELAPGEGTIDVRFSPKDGDLVPKEVIDEDKALRLLPSLAAKSLVQEQRFLSDRKIGALIVAEDGRVLAAGHNQNHCNKTLHAEVVALQAFWAKEKNALPRGAALYTTLEPCRMCATMFIRMASEPESVRVVYQNPDPGPHARHGILEGRVYYRP